VHRNACGAEHFSGHQAGGACANDGDVLVCICSHRLSVGGEYGAS
jgi:hypothetical protein